jgi:hypothetical protein
MNTLLNLITFSQLELPPSDISSVYLFSSMILDIRGYIIFTSIIITGVSVFILFLKKVDLTKIIQVGDTILAAARGIYSNLSHVERIKGYFDYKGESKSSSSSNSNSNSNNNNSSIALLRTSNTSSDNTSSTSTNTNTTSNKNG